MSLARKVSLLFGAAMLLTLSVTLVFPWLQMTALSRQTTLLQAKRAASVAYQDVNPDRPDWEAMQTAIGRRWSTLAPELGLPGNCPQLIPITAGLRRGAGFLAEAAERLNRNPRQQYYWRIQDNGRLFRFAMAIRATEVDPYPNLLRGLIDVRLPISKDREQWNTAATALAGATGAVLAILVFYMVTQRLVLSRVSSLRQVTEQVTGGDLQVQASIRSGDEFEELSEALNKMLTHLREAQEQQRIINRSLDIRLGELAEANVALFESNRLKSEFLANVSHELRTPLVSIIGFAELLRDAWAAPQADGKRLARYTENILASGRSLLELINDLLDIAKIEAGRMELHLSEFSVAELGADLMDVVRPLADKRNQKLSLEAAPNLPRMKSDSGKIKQVLYNLLSNAIKFTPPEGSITLRMEVPSETAVRLSVLDTGPGIPRDQQSVIFEKFRQLDASETREHEGTGLGLAITKELVSMLGGHIELDSGQGRGSIFSVTLPLMPEPELPRQRINLATTPRRLSASGIGSASGLG